MEVAVKKIYAETLEQQQIEVRQSRIWSLLLTILHLI